MFDRFAPSVAPAAPALLFRPPGVPWLPAIRPVRESDLGDRSDLAIARGALGGRFTTGKLPEKLFAVNRPKETYEQVAPRRSARKIQRPATRKGGR